jgi:hypothetical protein
MRAQKFLRRRGKGLSENGRLRFANPSPVDWSRNQASKVRHAAHRCRCPRGAGCACLRRRAVSPWLERCLATVIRRRLHAARLRGDGLSRAALVSLPGIVSCGRDHPAGAGRPPRLEDASLCGEIARFDAEGRLRGPGFARELTSGTAYGRPDSEHFRFAPRTCRPVRWQVDRAGIHVSALRPRRSTMNEQAVHKRRGTAPDVAEVVLYSALVLLVTLLSVYVPA